MRHQPDGSERQRHGSQTPSETQTPAQGLPGPSEGEGQEEKCWTCLDQDQQKLVGVADPQAAQMGRNDLWGPDQGYACETVAWRRRPGQGTKPCVKDLGENTALNQADRKRQSEDQD